MNAPALLDLLFPGGHEVRIEGDLIRGSATAAGQRITVLGTANHASIGVELAFALAGGVLEVVGSRPGEPILLLVDTDGQRLRRRDELLGINAYIAHLAQCVELARRRDHRTVSLVYSRAVSGGYIGAGMMADACFALTDAEISVMNLPAMARVTKIPLERLQELATTSPVFAPGPENYVAMGALDDVWNGDLVGALAAALRPSTPSADGRRERGLTRGGRVAAAGVALRVRHDAAA